MTLNAVILNTAIFTSLIGDSFAAGDRFIIDLVGPVNVRAHNERSHAVVWLSFMCGGWAFRSTDGIAYVQVTGEVKVGG